MPTTTDDLGTARTMQLLIAASLAAPGPDRQILLAELHVLPTADVVAAAVAIAAQYVPERKARRFLHALALV